MTSSLVDGSTVTGSPAGRHSLRAAEAPRRRRTGAHRVLRVLLGVVLVAVSGLLVVGQEQFRHTEAAAMTMLLKPFLGDDVFAFADQFVIRQDATHYLGLQITVECTTLVLLIPVLLFLAVMITFVQRLTWWRWALGELVGLVDDQCHQPGPDRDDRRFHPRLGRHRIRVVPPPRRQRFRPHRLRRNPGPHAPNHDRPPHHHNPQNPQPEGPGQLTHYPTNPAAQTPAPDMVLSVPERKPNT